MTMNRVQYQLGLSIAEFMDRYGSDDKCEAALMVLLQERAEAVERQCSASN